MVEFWTKKDPWERVRSFCSLIFFSVVFPVLCDVIFVWLFWLDAHVPSTQFDFILFKDKTDQDGWPVIFWQSFNIYRSFTIDVIQSNKNFLDLF